MSIGHATHHDTEPLSDQVVASTHRACRHGLSVRYFRLSRLLDEARIARGGGSYARLLDRLVHNAHRITLKGASVRRLYDSTKGGEDKTSR